MPNKHLVKLENQQLVIIHNEKDNIINITRIN